MARSYSHTSRRFNGRKGRRRTNPVRTYVVVAVVIALGAYGINWLRTSEPDLQQSASSEETLSAMVLPPAQPPNSDRGLDRSPGNTQVVPDTPTERGKAVDVPFRPAREAPDNPKVNEAVSTAVSKFKQNPGGVIELRERYNDMLKTMEMSPNQRDGIQHELERLSERWLFSPTVYDGDFLCQTYLVQPGDILERIGSRHKVPFEILQEINGIRRPRDLQAGRKIKIVNGPFHVRVRRSAFTMDLYLQTTYVKSYLVGLGMPGHETPTGTWVVEEGGKLIRPEWTDPNGHTFYPNDPDYPLGSRWIALQGMTGNAVGRMGFAIHGTESPHEIGKNTSRGCIRLNNDNAVQVYNLLLPGLSQVRVVD